MAKDKAPCEDGDSAPPAHRKRCEIGHVVLITILKHCVRDPGEEIDWPTMTSAEIMVKYKDALVAIAPHTQRLNKTLVAPLAKQLFTLDSEKADLWAAQLRWAYSRAVSWRYTAERVTEEMRTVVQSVRKLCHSSKSPSPSPSPPPWRPLRQETSAAETLWQLAAKDVPVADASAIADAESIWQDGLAPAPHPGDAQALHDLFVSESPEAELPVICSTHVAHELTGELIMMSRPP